MIKGFREKIKQQDYINWINGLYVKSAVTVAVEQCLTGKKARAKYIEHPVLQNLEEKNKPISEEDLQRQRELFVAKLEIMKTNFELSHPEKRRKKQ